MFLKNNYLNLNGYTDADWTGSVLDNKSTLHHFTFVGEKLIIWRNKKQRVVILSSTKVEFLGMIKGPCEFLWLKRLLTEIVFAPSFEMNLFYDNKVAIDISLIIPSSVIVLSTYK